MPKQVWRDSYGLPSLRHAAETTRDAGHEASVWVAPIERITAGHAPAIVALDDDRTLAKRPAASSAAASAGPFAPILNRLDLDLDAWLGLMSAAGSFIGGAFGRAAARAREVIRRGASWIVDVTRRLYREPEPTA